MTQLSLLEQARIEAPECTDKEHVALLAARLIEDLAATPPIDLELIASWQGVAKIQVEDIPWAGCLISDGAQVIMKLRSGDTRRRRRFTGFHEVGHTFCPGFLLEPQYRCTPSVVLSRPNIEGLCDVAASELLFPRRLVEADLAVADFGLDTVEEIAERYDGSFEAAAHRFVHLWPEDTLLLVLEPGFRKSERDDPEAVAKLRVRSAHASGIWPFIPRNKSVSEESALSRALLGELIDEPSTLDDLCIAVDRVDVSARLMPYRRDGEIVDRVLALYRRPSGRT
ncbi:MAG TPA: ImmA/IrrE family metallo-endopeptidase [Gaiellaceae bacterium]|nr:ImmA/IrrE family metallo-endopeptidase [Gaiellaceae bacterium]